ncbi:MAG TPA: hypothetical protein ENK80_05000 [Rhodobacterales bacterium]|nr:hypothetical protein [Rhodobacterales bacterium]
MLPEPGWISWVVRAALLLGLVAVWATSRALPERARLWARFLGVLLVTLVTSPLGWVHYLALPLLLLPGFAHLIDLRALLRLLVLTAALLSLPLLKLLAQYDSLAFVQAAINLAVALGLLALLLVKAHKRGQQALHPAPPSL